MKYHIPAKRTVSIFLHFTTIYLLFINLVSCIDPSAETPDETTPVSLVSHLLQKTTFCRSHSTSILNHEDPTPQVRKNTRPFDNRAPIIERILILGERKERVQTCRIMSTRYKNPSVERREDPPRPRLDGLRHYLNTPRPK